MRPEETEQAEERDPRAHPAEPGASQETPTAQPDPAEPAGEQDAANEAEIEEETERSEGMEEGDPRAHPAEPGASHESSEPEDPEAVLKRERDEYLALAQRAQADFENYRKRVAKEAAAAGDRAKGGLVRELLPVVDNLERALASAKESEQHLAKGVRLVHSELVAVLQRNGIEPFDPTGEPFDPEVHEALSTQPADGEGPGVVVGVMEKGYKLNGTVLRPARVVVSA
jgi:molecular chaperone GrpE